MNLIKFREYKQNMGYFLDSSMEVIDYVYVMYIFKYFFQLPGSGIEQRILDLNAQYSKIVEEK